MPRGCHPKPALQASSHYLTVRVHEERATLVQPGQVVAAERMLKEVAPGTKLLKPALELLARH